MKQRKTTQRTSFFSVTVLFLIIFAIQTVPLSMSKYVATGEGSASARVARWEPVWIYNNRYGDTKSALWDRGLAVAKAATAVSTLGTSEYQVFTIENKSEVTIDVICWLAFLTPYDAEFLAPSTATGAKQLYYDTATSQWKYQDYGFTNYIAKMNTQDPLAPKDSGKADNDPYNVAWQWFNDHKDKNITMAAFNYDGSTLNPATTNSLAWWLNIAAGNTAYANRLKCAAMARSGIYLNSEYDGTWRFRIDPGNIAAIKLIFNGTPTIASMTDDTGRMCKLFCKAVQVD